MWSVGPLIPWVYRPIGPPQRTLCKLLNHVDPFDTCNLKRVHVLIFYNELYCMSFTSSNFLHKLEFKWSHYQYPIPKGRLENQRSNEEKKQRKRIYHICHLQERR